MWPFKKKTDEELMVELYQKDTITFPDPNSNHSLGNTAQGASQQIGQAGQALTSNGQGQLAWGGGGGAGGAGGLANLTYGQMHQMISTMIIGLTKEEQAEYEQLKNEYAIKLKQAKLNIFKAICSEMRQTVINGYEWRACFANMNNATIEKDPRFDDLERKDNNGKIFMTNASGSVTKTGWYDQSNNGFFVNMPLPEGLTLEDLKQAHMEASLEEEMLSNEPNS